MGTMRILDHTGDTTVAWAEGDTDSTQQARALFERLHSEGKMAFARAAGAEPEETTLVHTFDPGAEEIIWLRPIKGG